MDITQDPKVKKKELEHGLEKLSQDSLTKDLKENKLPQFDLKDPHTQIWIKEQIEENQKTNPAFEFKDLIEMVFKNTTFYSKDEIFIDIEGLFVLDGRICAWAPDLKDLPEFDWDDPENIKMMAEEEEERVRKYGKLTSAQMEEIYKLKLVFISNDKTLSGKMAFDRAWETITGKTLLP